MLINLRRFAVLIVMFALFMGSASVPAATKAMDPAQGNKARITVREIKSGASECSYDMASAIGKMLSTALTNTKRFFVFSSEETAGTPTDLAVDITITKFEPESKGGGGLSGLKRKAMVKVGVETKSAEIRMDVKLVEVSSGRILKAKSIKAKSSKWGADIAFGGSVADVDLDSALNIFSNEPMEKAVRTALAQTVKLISNVVPKDYYRYTGEEQFGQESAAAETAGPAQEAETAGAVAEDMKLYTKYDFIPGDKVIFYDDMEDEEEGEFPYRWKLDRGVYEVVRLGKEFWIMATDDGSIRPRMPDAPLPPQYTVELEFYNNGPDHSGNYFYIHWVDNRGKNIGSFLVYSNDDTSLSIKGKSLADKRLPTDFTKGVHTMRIMATKRSIKCYVDEVRVANVPRIENFNPVGFRLRHRPYNDPENPTLFRGFRFAEGGKSMREQLDETGRIITHGILFDVDSYRIKGESYKTLKEIGQLLQDDPELRLSIEGHTDSDGSDTHNLDLSQKRANSVREYLISTYSISPDRLEAKGWGESKPIDTNDTAEGKANNRRVELVKL